MSNFKWGVIFALAAFLISVTLGIISGVSVFYIILRAFLFALLFFGFGIGIRFLINNFFPELMYGDESGRESALHGSDAPGSHINITVGNTGEYALPEPNRGGGQEQELGNIEDLVSGVFRPGSQSGSRGIDRKTEDAYNGGGGSFDEPDRDFNIRSAPGLQSADFQPLELQSADSGSFEKPAFNPSFGDGLGGLGGLPDLDSMAMAFSSGFDTAESAVHSSPHEEADTDFQHERHPQGNKPQTLQGDFNAEDLAKGIRTILSKDK